MGYYLILLFFSCLHVCEISTPGLLKQSGVQGNFSNFTEFSLLLFSCNIQNFLSKIFLAVPLSIFIWTLSFIPLSYLSLSLFYLILMELYSILFVSIQCGTLFWQGILAGPFWESFEASLLYPFWSLSWTHCAYLI